MSEHYKYEADFEMNLSDSNGKNTSVQRRNGYDLRIVTQYRGVYGMGEKFDSLNQIGKTVINEVVEKFCNQREYSYCVTPFFVTDNGVGVYIETREKTIFSFDKEICCRIPEDAKVIIFSGSISEIISEYMELFGKAKLPPEYAFGIWISANCWNSQRDVRTQLNYLKTYRFPATVIVLEAWSDEATFYIWNGAKYKAKEDSDGFEQEEFDFSESRYWNDPVRMIEEIHEQGLKLVLWQIPVYKAQTEEEFCEQLFYDRKYAVENKFCVMNDDGTPYEIPSGNWFEGAYIPDFTNSLARKNWFGKRKYLLDMGVDGFKTDGGEFIYSEKVLFSNGMTGKEGKNSYCQDYLKAYTEFIGMDNVLFSRAGYAGTHMTPIHWAGDHESTNQELKNVLMAGLSAAMSGIPFWGFDIGGFAGPLPTDDLYLRSTQFACFCPIMQWHSEPLGGQFKEILPGGKENNERSPWNIATHSNNTEFIDEIRFWHELRMSLIPYILSIAEEAAEKSGPMMRPLIYDFPDDEKVIDCDDEYMFGHCLLVAPFLGENERQRTVYLPKGKWYGFFSDKRYEGGGQHLSLEKMPVYVKQGAVLPMREEIGIRFRLYGKKGAGKVKFGNTEAEIHWNDEVVQVKGVMQEEYSYQIVV